MTYDEVVEKVAREIAYYTGAQKFVPASQWGDCLTAARAIVDMLKPKLVWEEVGGDWISDGYEIETVLDQFMLWAGIYEGADSRADRIGTFPTLKAAQAAAEAHAFAEWIKCTALGQEPTITPNDGSAVVVGPDVPAIDLRDTALGAGDE